MRLSKDYAAPKQEETAVEYIWEQKGCVQQRREPIVRCRDCKHFTPKGTHKFENGKVNEDYCDYVRGWLLQITPDGYCAWGDRKADA